jgi:hypothetical protein
VLPIAIAVLVLALPMPVATASLASARCDLRRLDPCIEVRFSVLNGFDDPATPNALDKVGVVKVGSHLARDVLVHNPGTSAGAGYFLPLARDIVRLTRGRWQVWSVERRENLSPDNEFLESLLPFLAAIH